MDQRSKNHQKLLDNSLPFKDDIDDFYYALDSIQKNILEKKIDTALLEASKLKKKYDEDQLKDFCRDSQLVSTTICGINYALNRLDDSLSQNTLKFVLIEYSDVFGWQAALNDIGEKMIKDLKSQVFEYAYYLLKTFFKVTPQWQKALLHQRFNELPPEFFNMLWEKSNFEFLMQCITGHGVYYFDERVGEKIWATINSDSIAKEIVYQHFEWMIDLSSTSYKYLDYFMKKGLVQKLLWSTQQASWINEGFVQLLTKFTYQMLLLDSHKIKKMQKMKQEKQYDYQRELMVFKLQQGFLDAYGFMINAELFKKQGFIRLHELKEILHHNYKEQLMNSIPSTAWYQQILLILLAQKDQLWIKKIAYKETSQWQDRNYWKYFTPHFLDNKDLFDKDTKNILGIK
ncbi:hypothetical protein pb186bvf_005906 [Paramecium bursaria]